MKAYLQFLILLRSRFEELRSKNSAFSIRSFARLLDLAPSTLSMALNGHRRLSAKTALRIADCLAFDPSERAQISEVFQEKGPIDLSAVQSLPSVRATKDQQAVFSDWHYMAILNLMRVRDFQFDPQWIADRLGIAVPEITEAIERLIRLGMIRKSESGAHERSAAAFRSSDDVVSVSMRKSHYQNLTLLKQSLDHHEIHDRDFSWITFSFEKKRLQEAKEAIRKFEAEFTENFTRGKENDEVYRLSVQMIPLTKLKKVLSLLFVFTSFFMAAPNAHAQSDHGGNGGNTVVCFDSHVSVDSLMVPGTVVSRTIPSSFLSHIISIESRDLFSAKKASGNKPTPSKIIPLRKNEEPFEYAARLARRLDDFEFLRDLGDSSSLLSLSHLLLIGTEAFKGRITWVSEEGLMPINDILPLEKISRHCVYSTVMVQRDIGGGQRELFIDQRLFSHPKHTKLSQAVLWMHERYLSAAHHLNQKQTLPTDTEWLREFVTLLIRKGSTYRQLIDLIRTHELFGVKANQPWREGDLWQEEDLIHLREIEQALKVASITNEPSMVEGVTKRANDVLERLTGINHFSRDSIYCLQENLKKVSIYPPIAQRVESKGCIFRITVEQNSNYFGPSSHVVPFLIGVTVSPEFVPLN